MHHKLHHRCPRCNKKRTWCVPYDHRFAFGHIWERRKEGFVCSWCVARETPGGEENLRKMIIEAHLENKKTRKLIKYNTNSVIKNTKRDC